MRYVMRIAKSSESSKLWTHLALPRKYVCWSVCSIPTKESFYEMAPFWGRLSSFGRNVWTFLLNELDTFRWNNEPAVISWNEITSRVEGKREEFGFAQPSILFNPPSMT